MEFIGGKPHGSEWRDDGNLTKIKIGKIFRFSSNVKIYKQVRKKVEIFAENIKYFKDFCNHTERKYHSKKSQIVFAVWPI